MHRHEGRDGRGGTRIGIKRNPYLLCFFEIFDHLTPMGACILYSYPKSVSIGISASLFV
jgi:hypothetical protein